MTTYSTKWTKGQTVRMFMGRCCPECGAGILGTIRTRGKSVRERFCKACGRVQINVSDGAECKVYMVGVPSC
jgi:uncharacterized protein (DUF983 family)